MDSVAEQKKRKKQRRNGEKLRSNCMLSMYSAADAGNLARYWY